MWQKFTDPALDYQEVRCFLLVFAFWPTNFFSSDGDFFSSEIDFSSEKEPLQTPY